MPACSGDLARMGWVFLKAKIMVLSTGSLTAQGLKNEDSSSVSGVLKNSNSEPDHRPA